MIIIISSSSISTIIHSCIRETVSFPRVWYVHFWVRPCMTAAIKYPCPSIRASFCWSISSQRQGVAVAWGCADSLCVWCHAMHLSRALQRIKLVRMCQLVLSHVCFCMSQTVFWLRELLPDMHVCSMQICQVPAVPCEQELVFIWHGYFTGIPLNVTSGFGAVTSVGAIHAITHAKACIAQ